jgi:hypothetical protein
MLIIYRRERGGVCVKELTEAAERLERNSRLGSDGRSHSGVVEHPGGDLEGACIVEV